MPDMPARAAGWPACENFAVWLLFGQLNADLFTLFSGSNRLLYERALAAVYESGKACSWRGTLEFEGKARAQCCRGRTVVPRTDTKRLRYPKKNAESGSSPGFLPKG
jgi:hypothetical protein